MKRALEWSGLFLAAASILLGFFWHSEAYLFLALSVVSLLLYSAPLWREWKSLLSLAPLLLGFAFFHFTLALPQEIGIDFLLAILIALFARVYFWKRYVNLQEKNAGFAKELEGLLPEKSLLFVDNDIEGEAETTTLQEGHLVRVHPGSRIPVDGVVTYGSTFVDESSLFGDPDPKTKGMGSFVSAGTLNKNGTIIIRASACNQESSPLRLANFLRLSLKEPRTTFVAWALLELIGLGGAFYFLQFTPPAALVSFSFLLFSGAAPFLAVSLLRTRSFVTRCAGEALVWNSPESIRHVAETEAIVCPPEGVVTEGRLHLNEIRVSASLSEEVALHFLAPLARKLESDASFAILKEIQIRNIPLECIDDFRLAPGGGSGLIAGEEVRWLDFETAVRERWQEDELKQFASESAEAGEVVHLLAREGMIVAVFTFSDKILANAKEALDVLHDHDLHLILASPLPKPALKALAGELGVTHWQAGMKNSEIEPLLDKLHSEKICPLWVQAPAFLAMQTPTPSVGTAALPPSQRTTSDLEALRWNLGVLTHGVLLAKKFGRQRAIGLFLFLIVQTVGPWLVWQLGNTYLDPKWIAIAGALPGFLLLFWAESLQNIRFLKNDI